MDEGAVLGAGRAVCEATEGAGAGAEVGVELELVDSEAGLGAGAHGEDDGAPVVANVCALDVDGRVEEAPAQGEGRAVTGGGDPQLGCGLEGVDLEEAAAGGARTTDEEDAAQNTGRADRRPAAREAGGEGGALELHPLDERAHVGVVGVLEELAIAAALVDPAGLDGEVLHQQPAQEEVTAEVREAGLLPQHLHAVVVDHAGGEAGGGVVGGVGAWQRRHQLQVAEGAGAVARLEEAAVAYHHAQDAVAEEGLRGGGRRVGGEAAYLELHPAAQRPVVGVLGGGEDVPTAVGEAAVLVGCGMAQDGAEVGVRPWLEAVLRVARSVVDEV